MSTLNLKRLAKVAVPLAALAALAGCETATPYQPLGYPGATGGYVDQCHTNGVDVYNKFLTNSAIARLGQ